MKNKRRSLLNKKRARTYENGDSLGLKARTDIIPRTVRGNETEASRYTVPSSKGQSYIQGQMASSSANRAERLASDKAKAKIAETSHPDPIYYERGVSVGKKKRTASRRRASGRISTVLSNSSGTLG